MPSSHLMSWCHYMSSFHRMSRCHYMSSFHPVSSCHPMPPSHLRSWSHYTSSSWCQHMSSGHFAYRSMFFLLVIKHIHPRVQLHVVSSSHVMMSLHSSVQHMSWCHYIHQVITRRNVIARQQVIPCHDVQVITFHDAIAPHQVVTCHEVIALAPTVDFSSQRAAPNFF